MFGGNVAGNKFFWTSTDGVTGWTQQQPGLPPQTGYDMTYANGLYLVVGKLGAWGCECSVLY